MEFELQCWDEENLEEYLEDHGLRTHNIALPWVVVSEHNGKEVVEFSSTDRAEAMAYI